MSIFLDNFYVVNLCQASDSDLENLISIRIEAMRESLERVGRFDPSRVRERLLIGFDARSTRRIEVSGDCVGFVIVRSYQDELSLDHLYILPRAQGVGIGSKVLIEIFKEADEIGKAIRVCALKKSRSNDFYIRHGFILVSSGEYDNYYIRASSRAVNCYDCPRGAKVGDNE